MCLSYTLLKPNHRPTIDDLWSHFLLILECLVGTFHFLNILKRPRLKCSPPLPAARSKAQKNLACSYCFISTIPTEGTVGFQDGCRVPSRVPMASISRDLLSAHNRGFPLCLSIEPLLNMVENTGDQETRKQNTYITDTSQIYIMCMCMCVIWKRDT